MVKDIGLKILMALREKNWEQKELARKAGISEGAVSYYIANKRSPKFEFLTKIARALNKPISYFTDEAEEMKLLLNGETSHSFGLHSAPVFEILGDGLRNWLANSHAPEDYPVAESTNSKDPKAFFVRVREDSMTGRINEKRCIIVGDLLLVEPGTEILEGDICFCWCEGQGAKVGRYKKYEDNLYLIPLNETHQSTVLKRDDKSLYFAITEIIAPLK